MLEVVHLYSHGSVVLWYASGERLEGRRGDPHLLVEVLLARDAGTAFFRGTDDHWEEVPAEEGLQVLAAQEPSPAGVSVTLPCEAFTPVVRRAKPASRVPEILAQEPLLRTDPRRAVQDALWILGGFLILGVAAIVALVAFFLRGQ